MHHQRLNIQTEAVQLAAADTVDVHAVSGLIPDDSARYHVFVYKHSHEGDQFTSVGLFDIHFLGRI